MTLNLGLSELVPTLEELLLIRQAQAEAEQNAASGGLFCKKDPPQQIVACLFVRCGFILKPDKKLKKFCGYPF